MKKVLNILIAAFILLAANVNAEQHEPGVYETTYGQALTTYNERQYELYFASRDNSTSPKITAGSPSGYKVVGNTSLSLAGDWYVANEIYGTNSTTWTGIAQFPNASMNHTFRGNTETITITVKGYDEIGLLLSDNSATDATKYFTVTINGTSKDMEHNTNMTLRSFSLDPTITSTIIVSRGSNTGGNCTLYAFSLRLPVILTPKITSFTVESVAADIDDEEGTITAELPVGTSLTSLTPEVIKNSAGDHYTPTGAQNFSNPVTYTVYDANDSKSKAYAVTLTVAASLSNDATLSDLRYKGTTIAGFASTTYSYSVELPYGTDVPKTSDIEATTTNARANVTDITRTNATFPTDIEILVTAEDGTPQSYIIHFTQAVPSADATLQWLKVNGVYVNLIDGVYDYTVKLNTTTTSATFTALKNNTNANVALPAPVAITNGSGSVVVTAQDGSKQTYNVTFELLPAPTKSWIFGDWDAKSYTTITTVEDLTINAESENKKIEIVKESAKAIDGYTTTMFEKRLKFGGTGSTSSRFISFQLSHNATIVIYGISGSNGSERSVAVHDGTSEIGTFTDSQKESSTASRGVIQYTHSGNGQKTIYLYSKDSGFNLYAIVVSEDQGGTTVINKTTAGKAIQSETYFDITGRKVSAETNGIVIVKKVYTDGSVASEKVIK